jgi:uncharacterized LabA/DUF88 family protein
LHSVHWAPVETNQEKVIQHSQLRPLAFALLNWCSFLTLQDSSEKKSDINIAVKFITDAMENLYDSAVLISADSDLTPAVDAIRTYFPEKKVLLFFPPKRSSLSLKKACHVYCGVLNRTTISKSQLPDTVLSKSGYPLKRPDHWT